MTERWKRVPGWPGYQVSDIGRVRSVDRVLSNGQACGGVMLATYPNRDGYPKVTLSGGKHKRQKQVTVHRLVMLAFEGPRPPGMEIRHLDSDPGNARRSNLAYGTHSQNEHDKRRTVGVVTVPPRPVRPQGPGVTLREAVQSGLVPCSLYTLRMGRHRGRSFPAPIGMRGSMHLYDADALNAWLAPRKAPGEHSGMCAGCSVPVAGRALYCGSTCRVRVWRARNSAILG
jgi:hypothetical protein